MHKPIVIYLASALFNGRETYFNSKLVEDLDRLGYKTNFPQRDGFEFGNLTKALSNKLPPEQIGSAVQNVIYFLDMGIFLPQSDVILANLDEPLDEGVVVEVSYAKLMDKFIIGLRTDVRSPYGSALDALKGMHFFPAYQCNKFISHYMPCKNPVEREEQFTSLVHKIDKTIRESGIQHKDELPTYASSNPNINSILESAEALFTGISNIHSEESLEKIALRYTENKEKLEAIGPYVYNNQ